MSCNCPNIMYATHEIIGPLSDFQNLDFIIQNLLVSSTNTHHHRKGIVFHDSIESAIGTKNFQENQLAPELHGKGLVKTFFCLMLDEYLKETYNDFHDPNGRYMILHATEAASTGLDIQDVNWVVQYGIPREMTMTLQRAGCCGHDGVTPSIFLLMFESWAREVDLHVSLEKESLIDTVQPTLDPDRPVCGEITEKITKKE
ncbi:hypothetical protein BDQ17DRAFT_1437123 [Cyathus striatus]|nr:hypothetical protein BDQ17DRAFT_1437123 [Cyathus striatus]